MSDSDIWWMVRGVLAGLGLFWLGFALGWRVRFWVLTKRIKVQAKFFAQKLDDDVCAELWGKP